MSSDENACGAGSRAGDELMEGSVYCSLSKHGLCCHTELLSHHFDLLTLGPGGSNLRSPNFKFPVSKWGKLSPSHETVVKVRQDSDWREFSTALARQGVQNGKRYYYWKIRHWKSGGVCELERCLKWEVMRGALLITLSGSLKFEIHQALIST